MIGMDSKKKISSVNSYGSSDESELENALKDLMAALKINQQNEKDRKPSQQVIKEFIESGAIK